MPHTEQKPSFEESIEQYESRIVGLETNLEEMALSGLITATTYKKRRKKLLTISEKLHNIEANWKFASGSTHLEHQSISLPPIGSCTPNEKNICDMVMKKRIKEMKKFYGDNQSVASWMKEVSEKNSNEILLNIRLSKMRSLMSTLNMQQQRLRKTKNAILKFIEEITKEEDKLQNRKLSPLDQLKSIFFNAVKLNKVIADMQSQTKYEEEKVDWMRRWLKLQETKMANYFPRKSIIDPQQTRKLSQNILLENVSNFSHEATKTDNSTLFNSNYTTQHHQQRSTPTININRTHKSKVRSYE
ncbi:MAG: hypothetical protein R3B45_01040 [Bdellovibrionota bacterium]